MLWPGIPNYYLPIYLKIKTRQTKHLTFIKSDLFKHSDCMS